MINAHIVDAIRTPAAAVKQRFLGTGWRGHGAAIGSRWRRAKASISS